MVFVSGNNERPVEGRTYGTNQQQSGPIYSHCSELKQLYFTASFPTTHTAGWTRSHSLLCFIDLLLDLFALQL